MTKVTVDVIYSLEGDNLPIILEVVDSEDIEYTLERQNYWRKFYEKVHVTAGVNFLKQK